MLSEVPQNWSHQPQTQCMCVVCGSVPAQSKITLKDALVVGMDAVLRNKPATGRKMS